MEAEKNPVELTYQLDKNDYLQYNKFVINRVPALKRQMILRFLLVPVIISLELFFLHLPVLNFLLIVLGVAVVWSGFLIWTQQRGVIAQTLARPGAVGLHTILLLPEGLREQTSVLEARVKWQNITEIADSPQVIVLFIGPRYGFVVPKRAFPTPEQAQAFLQTAQAYRQSAIYGTAPELPPVPASWPPAPQRLL
jgi:hypothetical protein